MACTLPLRVRTAALMGACAMAIVGGVMEIVNPSKVQVDIFKLAILAIYVNFMPKGLNEFGKLKKLKTMNIP